MRSVDAHDLLEHPGSSREVHLCEAVPGLRTELASVPEDRPVRAELLLESVVEGILVSGSISGAMTLSCARCLAPIEQGFEVSVQELFVTGRPTGDEYPIGEGSLDLEPMVRDAVVLTMPFSPLCRPDCLGLCPRCGGDRNLGECRCGPEVADPRWGALQKLFND